MDGKSTEVDERGVQGVWIQEGLKKRECETVEVKRGNEVSK